MKTRAQLLVLTAAGALAVPLLFTAATSAGDPDPRADAGAEPLDGGADGADAADGDAAPPLPSYRVEPFAEARSAEPRAKEWASAPKVALDRSRAGLFATTSRPDTCEARRLREWVRIRCTITTGAISLLGGDSQGLAMRLDDFKREEFLPSFPEGGEVVFPVRRGDRRAIEWLEIASGYKGMTSVTPSFVLSEQWPPGDEAPTIVAQ